MQHPSNRNGTNPPLDATASEEDVCAPAVVELETGAEAEVEGREPKTGFYTVT